MKQKEFFLQLGEIAETINFVSDPPLFRFTTAWNLTEKTDEEIDPPLIVKSFPQILDWESFH